MTRDDYDKLVVRHGPDPANWPADEKQAWLSFQARSPEKAATIAGQEQDFSLALKNAVTDPADIGLATRIAADVAGRNSQALSVRKLLISGGLTAITSTLAGVMLALMLDVNMLDYPLEGDIATTMLIEPDLIWTEE